MSVEADIQYIETSIETMFGKNALINKVWDRLKERIQVTTVSKAALDCCKHDLESWFATIVPEAAEGELRKVVEADIGLSVLLHAYYDTASGGLDTADRDALTNVLAHTLLGRSWPLNMDTPEYQQAFRRDWSIKCVELGWTFGSD